MAKDASELPKDGVEEMLWNDLVACRERTIFAFHPAAEFPNEVLRGSCRVLANVQAKQAFKRWFEHVTR